LLYIEQGDPKTVRGQLKRDGAADQAAADHYYIKTVHKIMIAGIEQVIE